MPGLWRRRTRAEPDRSTESVSAETPDSPSATPARPSEEAESSPPLPPESPPPRLPRWRTLLLLLLLAASLGLLWVRLPSVLGELASAALSAALERQSRIESIQLSFDPFGIEIVNLRISGKKPGRSFVFVPSLLLVPALETLGGPRLAFERVRVRGLRLYIRAYPEGGDDIPKPKRKKSGGGLEVRIRRLSIEDGMFELDHNRVPLELDLPNLKARLAQGRAAALLGTLS